MIKKIYNILDLKTKAYLEPFFVTNEAIAFRIIDNCFADKKHTFTLNTSDYILYYIGEYDDCTGMCKMNNEPELITNFISLKNRGEQNELT